MRIAVAGGTGTVGVHVVRQLQASGHEVTVLTRGTGVDLLTGAGLAQALDGVAAVVDVANVTTLRAATAVDFFRTAGQHLLAAERQAGVGHHICLSIVGSDRVDFGYYQGKRIQEQVVRESGQPFTILRATQFYEFAGQLVQRSPGPLAVVPAMRSQPVAATEVAATLTELATAGPQGMAPELAGPQVHEMADLVREVLRAQGSRKRVVRLRLPGGTGAAMATGALLPTGAGPRGTLTFAQWLSRSRD